MEKSNAVAALGALAQDNRLDVYRLLVQAGLDGLPAGQVSAKLELAPNTLTFHFDRLRAAGLVTVRREGRSMIYEARFETMNALLSYLTDNCCGGAPERPARHRGVANPQRPRTGKPRAGKRKRHCDGNRGTTIQRALPLHRQFGPFNHGR